MRESSAVKLGYYRAGLSRPLSRRAARRDAVAGPIGIAVAGNAGNGTLRTRLSPPHRVAGQRAWLDDQLGARTLSGAPSRRPLVSGLGSSNGESGAALPAVRRAENGRGAGREKECRGER